MVYPVVEESIFDSVTNCLETNVKRILDCISKELESLQNCPSTTNNMSFPYRKESAVQKLTHAFHSITKKIHNKLASFWKEESFYDVVCKRCKYVYLMISDFLAGHGWHIFFAVLVGIILWTNLKPKFDGWRWRRRSTAQILDPNDVIRRYEALEIARQKMQEQHDNQAAAHKEKMRKTAPAPKLPDKSKLLKSSASKERLVPEVNPLSRAYCGPSYRPARSGFNSGGG